MTEAKSPSRAEQTAVKVKLVRELIERRTAIADIKRSFAQRFNCTERAAERFITLAYELMRQDTEKPIEQHKVDSLYEYRKVLKDPQAKHVDRIRAQERIDKILGLEAEIKISTNGNTNVTVSPAMTPAQQADLIQRVLGDASEAVAAEDPDTGDGESDETVPA